jgi:hypothetical protein
MDERQVYLKAGGFSQQSAGRPHQASMAGLRTDGGREYHLLLEEGHYRCPHCRRADTHEMSIPAAYRR